MQIVKYKPAKLGLGTESSQRLQPLEFSPNIVNRFYNLLGDLQKRNGMVQIGGTITVTCTSGFAPGNTTALAIDALHEYIDASGNAFLIATGSNGLRQNGASYFSTTASAWMPLGRIGDDVISGSAGRVSPSGPLQSVQMDDKLIFFNGKGRNVYLTKSQIELGNNARWTELKSVILRGTTGAGSNSTTLFDADISNWRTQTYVAINDLVEIPTPTSAGALTPDNLYRYAIITSVGTSSLDMTQLGGTGSTGLGAAFAYTVGCPYRIIDTVELNIIPVTANTFVGETVVFDNVAVAGAATNTSVIAVTALDFSTTQIRQGDLIYNTTRAAITKATSVSANLNVASVSGQVAGDSLVFLKQAMPIATFGHVHYGRLHLIDARDQTKIRVGGPSDPEDFTTFNKTLSSVTIDYGSRQPRGDALLTMSTFGRYLVVGGKQAVYATDGTNPIADVTADVVDLDPVGLFPQGVLSSRSMANIGQEMLYISSDGLRSFRAAFSEKNTVTDNRAEQIKTELIHQLNLQVSADTNIQLVHYPRRNWVMLKVGSTIYNYNFTPTYQMGQFNNFGTFTKFSGLVANQTCYLVRRDGTIVAADSTGKVYRCDVSGIFTDNGANISTTYVSPWHTLQEGQNNLDINIVDGRYIRPIFETSAVIKYNISVVGDWDQIATDSVIVTSNSTGITNPKVPLRWRGKQAQFTITTDTSVGADIINSYTVYGNIFGRR